MTVTSIDKSVLKGIAMSPTPKAGIFTGTPSPERCVSKEAATEVLAGTEPKLLALPPFKGERRGTWDSDARWPNPETMRLLHAQCSWIEGGSVGDSPLALLTSLDESQPEAGA